MKTQIPKIYKPLLDPNDTRRYYVFYGGRGGGKSENIAQSLVILAGLKRVRILCIREAQSSIAESVKSLIEKWIEKLKVEKIFRITNTSIKCLKTGSEFLFMGMRSHTAVNVKSVNDIGITWIEEAEAFSQRSWDLLVPSVTRSDNPKIIISFNPYKEDDTIYKEFIVNRPPKDSLVLKVNYTDNPFFENSYLAQLRADDEERLPTEVYRHRWLGEILTNIEGSLFKNVDFSPIPLAGVRFIKRVIACDPATTNKDYSNEYGIVVLGKTMNGLIVVLDDYSGKYTPFEFANMVNKASKDYDTNKVVVETNQGGDFIKATLISVNPHFEVFEVRAGSAKTDRALPVANLMDMRKVVFGNDLPKIKRQLELMTNIGYLGFKGESPDRADAMIWGVYYLADIVDKDSIYTVFDKNWFNLDNLFLTKGYQFTDNVIYIYPDLNVFIAIKVKFYKYHDEVKAYIEDSFTTENIETIVSLPGLKIAKNVPFMDSLIAKYNFGTYTPVKEKELDKKVMNILPICKLNKVMVNDNSNNAYNNNYGNLLNIELMEFKLESDRKFSFIELLCDIIYTEFNLPKDD